MKTGRVRGCVLMLILLIVIAGCPQPTNSSDDDSRPPAVVAVEPPTVADEPVMHPDVEVYQLLLEQSTSDPRLRYRAASLPLPEWILLDEESGEVTVDTDEAVPSLAAPDEREATVAFYTSFNDSADDDAAGGSTIDQAFAVTFYIARASVSD
ncbi:MAG: hypothetical protein EA384_14055 [Spirochaetaceae bacterium]|nr:MAG: hypothetical protein EA384_14055 [Spirochaetaceae bacterium]